MGHERRQVVSEDELRELIPEPLARAREKLHHRLDNVDRDFLAAARLYFVATSDAAGNLVVSPKGDPAGEIVVLDDTTIALPERSGNRRVDGLLNLLQDPHISIEFLVPGRDETLRISGTAVVLADAPYAPQMAVKGRLPLTITEVSIDDVFLHCTKAIMRSQAWVPDSWAVKC